MTISDNYNSMSMGSSSDGDSQRSTKRRRVVKISKKTREKISIASDIAELWEENTSKTSNNIPKNVIEKILDHKIVSKRNHKYSYKVKWLGDEDITWESGDNVSSYDKEKYWKDMKKNSK